MGSISNEWGFDPSELPLFKQRKLEQMNIEFKKPIYQTLDEHAVEGIEQLVSEYDYDSVQLLDDETIEIRMYPEDSDNELGVYTRDAIGSIIQSFFGEWWRVQFKPDDRMRDGENKRCLLVQCIRGRRFKYRDETDAEYKLMARGTPDGVPEDARQWGDLEHIVNDRITTETNYRHRLYVHESSTGTKHLISTKQNSYLDGLADRSVTEGCTAECGMWLDPQTIADPDEFRFYGRAVEDYLNEQEHVPQETKLTPELLFGEDLCRSCWHSYADVVRGDDGSIRKVREPVIDWWLFVTKREKKSVV